jgi:chromosome segregation ATPase
VFEPGHPPPSPWEEALLVERRTGLARLRTATNEANVAIQQRDENAREKEALGQQLHARNLEFDELGESARAEKEHVVAERDRLGRELEAVRARLAEVEADLDDVQTRRRDAEKALRVTTRRLEARERSLPIRVARAIKRVRRR